MRTKNISFKGIRFVNGTAKELEAVENEINAHTTQPGSLYSTNPHLITSNPDNRITKTTVKHRTNFSYQRIRYRGFDTPNNVIDLFMTEDEAHAFMTKKVLGNKVELNRLIYYSFVFKDTAPQSNKAQASWRRFLETAQPIIEQHFKLPSIIIPAKTIVAAIKSETFEFRTLEILR